MTQDFGCGCALSFAVLLEKQQEDDVLKGQLLYVAKNEYNKPKLVVATPRSDVPSCALVILDPNTDSLRGSPWAERFKGSACYRLTEDEIADAREQFLQECRPVANIL